MLDFGEVNKKYPVTTESICCVGKEVWFAHNVVNILFCVNVIQKSQKSYIIPFKERIGVAYSDILYNNGKLYLIPLWGMRIVVFDIANEIFDEIELEELDDATICRRYCAGRIVDNTLYLIPEGDRFLSIDLYSKNICQNYIYKYFTNNNLNGFYNASGLNNNIFIAGARNHAGLLYIDANNNVINWKWESLFLGNFYGMDTDGTILFAHCPKEKKIISFDTYTEEIINNTIINTDAPAYVNFLQGKYLCLDYYLQSKYEIYDTALNLVFEGDSFPKDCDHGKVEFDTYFGVWCDACDGRAVWFNNCTGEMRIYDDLLSDYESFYPIINTELINELSYYYSFEGVSVENKYYLLENFLFHIVNNNL